MNLILHHLRKDIRSLRVPLAIWLLVILVAALPDLFISQPDYVAARTISIDRLRDSLLTSFVGILAWTLLIALLIQSEPVTGSASFWLTRPIPRRVYVLSKFSFLALVVIVPGCLPAAAQAYAFGTDFHDFQGQLLSFLPLQLCTALVVIWLATYSRNLLYFVGMLCLGLIGLVLANVATINLRHNYGGTGSGVAVTCVLFGLLVSLVVAHVWRRPRAGFYTAVTFMTLGLVYWFLTPTSLGGNASYSPKLVGRSVPVDFQPAWSDTVTWSHALNPSSEPFNTIGEEFPAANAILHPAQEIPGGEIWVNHVSAQFDVLGDISCELSSGDTSSYLAFNAGEKRTFDLAQAWLPNIKLVDTYPKDSNRGYYNANLFSLSGVEPKVRDKTGRLTLHVDGHVMSLRQLAALPLNDPHDVARVPGGWLRVVPLTSGNKPQGLSVWVVSLQTSDEDPLYFVLVDPGTSTGKALYVRSESSVGGSLAFIGTRQVIDTDLSLPLDGTEPLGRMVLYVFDFVPTADFSTTLVAPNFKMTPVFQN